MTEPLPESEVHESHGHSTAAWTGVSIMLVGAAIICLGTIFANPIMWGPGVIVFAIGAIAWPVMNRSGYGTDGPKNRMGH